MFLENYISSFFELKSKREQINLTEKDRNVSDDTDFCQIFGYYFSKIIFDLQIPHLINNGNVTQI